MNQQAKNKFEGWKVIKESSNFILMYNPDSNPFAENEYNYIIVYKPLQKIEVQGDSYPQMVSYLDVAESALNSTMEANAPLVDERGTPVQH